MTPATSVRIAVLGALISVMFLAGSAFVSQAQETTETTTEAPSLSPLGLAIKQELDARADSAKSKSLQARLSAIQEFYSENQYKPIWVKDGKPSTKARELVETLNRAQEDGLHPEDYDALALFQKLGAGNDSTLADLEIHLSTTLVSFAQHMNAGRVNPRAVNREIVIYPEAISSGKILQRASKTKNIKAFLRLLAPHTPRYERLRVALSKYRRIAKQGGWVEIPAGEVLKPDMEDERVPLLEKRLVVSGDLPQSAVGGGNLYDTLLVDAVMRFQARHGLAVDGVIGSNTLKELNVPIEARIASMEYNLERRRWMQNDYGPHYIFANLADQVVKLVKNEKTVHAALIQVGQPYHRTPVFTDEMEYLEINPYWNVPKSIAVNELLPKLQNNPNHYTSQGFQVLRGGSVISASSVPWHSYSKANFPVRLRQGPGKKNALGRIKFMFPNKFNVYLHDTPSKQNFAKASRFFSHGCLRLQDPLKMAEHILGDQGWSRGKIDGVVSSGKRTVVKLEKKIPVHIAYLTSWVNKDGSVHFRRDVYGRDKILANALAKVRGR